MKEGYNDDLFEIKCKKCGSTNCSIIDDDLINCIHRDLRTSFNIGHNGDAKKIS